MAGRKRKASGPTGELADTLKDVNTQYGAGTARSASENLQPDRISTGVFIMDLATLGGIPHNRGTMVIGEKHAGKTTLSSKVVASAQKQYPDQVPVYLDIEGTYDSTWARKLGVDTDNMQLVHCETGEMAADIGEAVVKSKETSLLIVDSIAALTPMKEVESSAEDAHVGLQSRLMGGFIRKITSALIRERKRGHKVTVLYINQFRTKIGGYSPHGDPRTTPGGKAIEYSTSLQVILKNKENKGKAETGIDTMAYNDHPYTITKLKTNNGPRTGEFALVRDSSYAPSAKEGDIDNAPTLLTYAKKFGLYTGAGKNQKLSFLDHSFNFGKQDQCIQMLREDHNIMTELWWYLVAQQAISLDMPDEFVKRTLNMKNHFME